MPELSEEGQLEELDQQPLSPEEVRDMLRATKLEVLGPLIEANIDLIIPDSSEIPEQFRGKNLVQVIERLEALTQDYEGPGYVETPTEEEAEEEESSPVPSWLQGVEHLVWHGAPDNPIWTVRARRRGDDVSIAYSRRGAEIRPGRTKEEQLIGLEPIVATFSDSEWRVIESVLKDYYELEDQFDKERKVRIKEFRSFWAKFRADKKKRLKAFTESFPSDEEVPEHLREAEMLPVIQSYLEQKGEFELQDEPFEEDEFLESMVLKVKEYEDDEERRRQEASTYLRETYTSEARDQMLAVLREENTYRPRSGKLLELQDAQDKQEGRERTVKAPEVLDKAVDEVISKLSQRTRGFDAATIEKDKVTEYVAFLLSQLMVLNRSRGDGREDIPDVKPEIIEIPSFALALRDFSEKATIQLGAPHQMDIEDDESAIRKSKAKGVMLLIGEPGTGKNEVVEYFAAHTGRPFYTLACGRGMEALDLVHHYEFDSKEGTLKFLTDLAQGLQTPGAVVLIDEVNALKPEVQAILHGLGDGRRSLDYDGVTIPVAEDVIIVIAGNPATQGSAGNLSEALLSRTRGQSVLMDYPALTKGELRQREESWSDAERMQQEADDNSLKEFAIDEALVLYTQLPEFKDLSVEEFSLLWEKVVNDRGAESDFDDSKVLKALWESADKTALEKTLIDMRDILRIADRWRKYFERKEVAGFEIVGVSLRDTIALMKRYQTLRDVRKTYISIFNDFRKNPIAGLDVTLLSLEQEINTLLGGSEPAPEA